jgi:carbon storage regulator
VLVLTRKPGQSIVIGDDIEVTVLEVNGAKVRLGIKAPSSVPVHRLEVYVAINSASGEQTASEPREQRSLRRQAS